MKKMILEEGDEGVQLIVGYHRESNPAGRSRRSPVHVVYGGAHLFRADTPQKLGRIALRAFETYAATAKDLAAAFDLRQLSEDRIEAIHQRTAEKLKTDPVEDLRIDFEDGYGFRTDEEEDAHARSAAAELASAFNDGTITPFSGFRIKSLNPETHDRAVRTLELLLESFLELSGGRLPDNFVVTLPKISDRGQVKELAERLTKIEEKASLEPGSIGIEIMVETPQAIFDHKGRVALPKLVKAAGGRCRSAHFGAYDYTSLLGITAKHQHLGHAACSFARQTMLAVLAPLRVRVSDSVTTELPVPPHRGDTLTAGQIEENRKIIHAAWKTHFDNITRSMANGFYQSWDLHPNQLVARYAAVYAFFSESMDAQAGRLRGFIKKARQASLTGNVFDDAASVQGLVNFFRRGSDCGAFTADEIEKTTGLSPEELMSGSFRT